MQTLNMGIIEFKFKVDNIEVKVETTIVGVLKEVFGVCDALVPMAVVDDDAMNFDLAPLAKNNPNQTLPPIVAHDAEENDGHG